MRFAERHTLPESENYLEVDCGDFRVIGRSLAGVETVFACPQLGVTFDTGRAPGFAVPLDFLALTHCHMDHAGTLAFYLGLRCLNDLKPLKIVAPPQKCGELEIYLGALKKLSESQIAYEILPADRPVALKKDLTLRAAPSQHCVAANGYVVARAKKKLKAEYRGLPPGEIVRAKTRGLEVDEETSETLLAVSGDTRGTFLEGEAAAAKTLFMECTFFDDDADLAKIRLYGHTHIRDWREQAERIRGETVVMTHTSQRYSRAEIEAYCRRHLPRDLLERLVVFR